MSEYDFEDFIGPWKREGEQWDLWEFTTAKERFDEHPRNVYKIGEAHD